MTPPNHSSSSSRKACRVLLLTATLTAPGCQLAFGTYSGNVSQDTGGTTGAGGAATGGVAANGGAASGGDTTNAGGTAGSGGCTNTDLSYCGDTTDAGTPLFACDVKTQRFIQSDTCKSPLYCLVGVDHCVLCKVDETHCDWSDAGALTGRGKSCESDQLHWNDYPCQNGGCIPDAGAGIGTPDRCDICTERSTQCVDVQQGTVTLHYKRTCLNANWQTEDCPNGCQPPSSNGSPAVCITQTTH